MRSKVKHIAFPVFSNYIVHVEITSDLKRSMAKYPPTRAVIEAADEACDGMTIHVEDETFSYIFLPYNASVGTIAHESWHTIKAMMEHLAIELDSETVAYHLGYLVDQIFRFMRGRKR